MSEKNLSLCSQLSNSSAVLHTYNFAAMRDIWPACHLHHIDRVRLIVSLKNARETTHSRCLKRKILCRTQVIQDAKGKNNRTTAFTTHLRLLIKKNTRGAARATRWKLTQASFIFNIALHRVSLTHICFLTFATQTNSRRYIE